MIRTTPFLVIGQVAQPCSSCRSSQRLAGPMQQLIDLLVGRRLQAQLGLVARSSSLSPARGQRKMDSAEGCQTG